MTLPEGENPDPSELPEVQRPMSEILRDAERQDGLNLTYLYPGDHLHLTFINEADQDNVSYLQGDFVVDRFEASYRLNPGIPIPLLRYVQGNALPEIYQAQTLKFSGSASGATSLKQSAVLTDHPLEMSAPDGYRFHSPPVAEFRVLRPTADGREVEVPLNALNRIFESHGYDAAQELMMSVEAGLPDLGIELKPSLDRRLGIPGGPDEAYDGEALIGEDYVCAQAGQYFILSGETRTVYVLSRDQKQNHIQIGEYHDVTPEDVAQYFKYGISIGRLNATGCENITYNASNSSAVFEGGISYCPSSNDTTEQLGITSAVIGDTERVSSPEVNIGPAGQSHVEIYSYLYAGEKSVSQAAADHIHAQRSADELTVQIGEKTVRFPTKFDDRDLQATLSRMRAGKQ